MRKNNNVTPIPKNLLLKTELLTSLSIFIGILFYKKLPEQMAIHVNVSNQGNLILPKIICLLLLPLFFACIQVVILKANTSIPKSNFRHIMNWFLPVLSILSQSMLITYNINGHTNIVWFAAIIVGLVYILLGNYLPKNSILPTQLSFKAKHYLSWSFVVLGGILVLLGWLSQWFSLFIVTLLLLLTLYIAAKSILRY